MYKSLLIWRYFLHKRVAFIAVVGVALLVMAVLVVLSVMSGLLEDARSRNHAWTGDVVLVRDSLVGFDHYEEFMARLAQAEIAQASTPVITTYGLVMGSPTQLFGVRLGEFCRVTDFGRQMHLQAGEPEPDFVLPEYGRDKGGLARLEADQRRRGIIIHVRRDDRKHFETLLESGRGEPQVFWSIDVTAFAVSHRGLLTGSELGETQRFWYVDDYMTRLLDLESAAMVDFDVLGALTWMDGQDGAPRRTNELRIKLREGLDLAEGRAAVASLWAQFVSEKEAAGQAKLLSDVRVESWKAFRRSQIAPVENEKSLMTVVFLLIAVVAVFIVFAIFYMIVTEKIKDLGIIKSVGGSAWGTSQIFLGYGALVGLIGVVLGTALGYAIVTHSNDLDGWLYAHFGWQLWPPDVYFGIEKIPDQVASGQAAVIAVVGVLASVVGAALPAWRAARLQVVEALRVE